MVGMNNDVLTSKLQTVLTDFEGYEKASLNRMLEQEKYLNQYFQPDLKTRVSERIKSYRPKGVDDITKYNPSMEFNSETNVFKIIIPNTASN